MIREVARCPYCKVISAGIDDNRSEFILAPDRADGQPCRHLAFLLVGLETFSGDEVDWEWSGHWLWVRGTGLHKFATSPTGPVAEFLDLWGCEQLVEDFLPTTEHQVTGGTAGARESARPGSGEFPISADGERLQVGILDGWGYYSLTPDALVAEVRALAPINYRPER